MFGMFGEDGDTVEGTASPSTWSTVGNAITGAVTGLAQKFPDVAQSVLTAKATEAAAKAQRKRDEAEAKKLAAQKALQLPTVQKSLWASSKWAIPVAVGGAALLGVALWLKFRKK
jgi:hypothetical protein